MVVLRWISRAAGVDPALRRRLVECWRDVSNAGGAVGFPYLPVGYDDVAPEVDGLLRDLDAGTSHLLVGLGAAAGGGESLLGWVVLDHRPTRREGHWGRVRSLQTDLPARGRRLGCRLMAEVARHAREGLGLEHLVLELRSGTGLEDYYVRLGWQVYGLHRGALRVAPDDTRDKVLMRLDLA